LAKAGEEHGKERYRGLELNAYANLLGKTLRPSVGMSFIRSDLINFPKWDDNIVRKGHQVTSPKFIAKVGVEWDTPFAKGLTLNANVQHYGKSYQDAEQKYKLPSYTLVDIGARYKTTLGGNTLTIGTAVENEKVYFIDSTQKDDNNDGVYEINGVTARNYEKNDSRIKAYGKMRLAY